MLVAQTVIAETCSCPSSTEIFNKTMKGPAEQTFLTLTLLTFSLMPGENVFPCLNLHIIA